MAVQMTFLNAHTAAKADLPVVKRSFGIVKGSTVTLQETQGSNIFFVAEGIETALSLKSSGVQGTIKASLGLSNIKHIVPESPHTHFVICADHDAPDSSAAKSLEKSVLSLQERGFAVTVIKPDKLGDDFNDVLKAKGPQGVRDILERTLFHDKDLDRADSSPELNSQGFDSSKFNSNPSNSFANIRQHCEQRLYDLLERNGKPLTSERTERISLQAERTATFILHSYGERNFLPSEDEMINLSLRAKYELDRLPEIQQDLMDEGEENAFRAYRIAERLASIEGRLTFEAMQQGREPLLHLSYVAKKELAQHREQLPYLTQDLKQKHFLSDSAAQHCAQDILRYKETHGQNPSEGQIAKMMQISRELENKDYHHLSCNRDTAEIEFLRRREGDLLFKYGTSYNSSSALIQSHTHTKKSLENIQSHLAKEREFIFQRDLNL